MILSRPDECMNITECRQAEERGRSHGTTSLAAVLDLSITAFPVLTVLFPNTALPMQTQASPRTWWSYSAPYDRLTIGLGGEPDTGGPANAHHIPFLKYAR